MEIDNSKIFVSYSRQDSSDFAIRLYKDLKSKGLNIWLDQFEIQPGEFWDDEIDKALKSCGQLLIILSPESVTSENVKNELHDAIKKKKIILTKCWAFNQALKIIWCGN